MDTDPTGALEDSLDDWLGAPVPVADEGPEYGLDGRTERERVLPAPDEDVADRLMARARRLEREQERVDQLASARKAEIDAWAADLTDGVKAERGRIRTSLDLFMRQWHRVNPKRKSVPLPNGKLSLRAPSPPKVDVTDEHAFVRWAEENDRKDLLRYRPEPNKTAIALEAGRHAQPDATIENPETGEGELHRTWSIRAVVLSDRTTGEQMVAEVPGVRIVQRVHDRFSFKLPEETQASEETP